MPEHNYNGSSDDKEASIKPFSLRFSDRNLENKFQESWLKGTHKISRVWSGAALFVYINYSILLTLYIHEYNDIITIVRFYIIIPIILISILPIFTYPKLKGTLPYAYFLGHFSAFGASLYLFLHADSQNSLIFVLEMLVILVFAQNYNRILFSWTLVFTSSAITLTIIGLGFGPQGHEIPAIPLIFVVTALSLTGVFAAYTREIFVRRNYQSIRVLKSEKLRTEEFAQEADAARREARTSESRIRSLAESVPDAIVTRDGDNRLIYWNKAAEQMFNYSSFEAVQIDPVRLVVPEERQRYQQAVARAGEKWSGGWVRSSPLELTGVRNGGDQFPMDLSISFSRSGSQTFRTEVFRDVSDRKTAEQERDEALAKFHEAQKHESLGTLAAGVAHDFNNILGIMNGYTHLALDDAPENSPIRKMLEETIRAGERGAALVRQILAYTRSDENVDAVACLDRSVSETVNMLQSTLPATIRLDLQIPSLQVHVRADETRIHQLVTNLCINAAHAIGSRPGTIKVSCNVEKVSQHSGANLRQLLDAKNADAITTEQQPDGQGGMLWFGAVSPGDYVHLTVEDDGAGIDSSTLDRIVEPFFTTKAVGEGTGLGLSAVAGITRSARGAFTIESRVGQGTRFDLYFPLVEVGTVSSEMDVSELRRVPHEARA
ncbi:MAG: ATP-binding protein [Gammaproteobacteria bacterium]|nr:ATP-binding protein [Gammaproteobacteria bacterium]